LKLGIRLLNEKRRLLSIFPAWGSGRIINQHLPVGLVLWMIRPLLSNTSSKQKFLFIRQEKLEGILAFPGGGDVQQVWHSITGAP